VLGRAHQAALGKPLQSFMTPAYLDARVHALYDKIPALCYGPISENIHGFDERFSMASMRRVTRAMALFVAEWCGVETIQP
jgi:acetylornithine deacetylase